MATGVPLRNGLFGAQGRMLLTAANEGGADARNFNVAVVISADTNLSLLDWLFRGMVFGMMGILGFSALVVVFFLIYSPIYLVNKVPHLVGKGGWLDKREVRFYLACFALICLLVSLLAWSSEAFTMLLVLLAGFGPLVWRLLV